MGEQTKKLGSNKFWSCKKMGVKKNRVKQICGTKGWGQKCHGQNMFGVKENSGHIFWSQQIVGVKILWWSNKFGGQ